MKHTRLTLLAACLCLSFAAWAQPSKGSVMIGGSAGINSYKYEEYSSTTIRLSPFAAFFIADQIAIGGSLGLEFRGGDADGSTFSIGPIGRYYVNNDGDARFFGQVGIQYSVIDLGGNSDSFSNFGWGVAAGVDWFLNPNVALEAALSYTSDKDEDAEESDSNIGLNIGVAAFIGN